MSFGVLALIVVAGLGGPLLAAGGRGFVPVVVGEIAAGLVIGRTGLQSINPGNTTLVFLSNTGFAMLMLTVGMHLPLRDRRLLGALRGGTVQAVLVGLLAAPAGIVAAKIAGGGHAAVYAVVLASGSAAVVMPTLEEQVHGGIDVLTAMVQITVADVVTIVAVPVALQPSRVSHAALGGVLVSVTAICLLVLERQARGRAWIHRLRHLSKEDHWALDLRVSLIVLFLLAWLADLSGTSVLIAGFAAGLVVAVAGGPKRLSTQVRGIADGFFIPLYFVTLGAQLDLRALVSHPNALGLVVGLSVLNVVIHALACAVTRRPQPIGLIACAQLGVPAAVASLGLAEHVLSSGDATAIVTAAVVSLGVSALGVGLLTRSAETPLPVPVPPTVS